MTDYPVQCFDHNGEPYGTYVLPEYFEYSFLMIGWSSPSSFINANTFPMPGAEVGKTYERDEVEVVKEMSSIAVKSKSTYWVPEGIHSVMETGKKQFRLVISKTETTTTAEKEPETVDRAEHKKITGFDTPSERKAYEEGYNDAISVCMDYIRKWKGTTNSGLGEILYNKFIEWQKQKSK